MTVQPVRVSETNGPFSAATRWLSVDSQGAQSVSAQPGWRKTGANHVAPARRSSFHGCVIVLLPANKQCSPSLRKIDPDSF